MKIEIKKLWIFAAILACGVLSFSACRTVEIVADDIDIPGLGGTEEIQNDVDKWLLSNFTEPYNIEVVYRWDAAQMYSNLATSLVPIEYEAVKPMLATLRDVWFEPYNEVAGVDFLKGMSPKKIVLVGSPEYVNGAIKLGQAEGGRKIMLLNANNFDPKDGANVRLCLQTIIHEFSHILHQLVLYDKRYQEISAGRYDPSGWQENSDAFAYTQGFVSAYSMSAKDEDFVELLSMVLVYGADWFEDTVIAGARKSSYVNAEADLRLKLSIIDEYLQNTWNINMYDIAGKPGLESLIQEAIATVLQTPPTE